jgi:CubicO group peptidase (beta-lactamase class C family)
MAEPEEVGMCSKRLERVRTAMERYVDRQLVPGVLSLVARDGKVVYLDSVGYRDVEAQKPMTADTIFRIMSMTKPIASVALMMLYEEGHFLLSSRIKKWIPEFADPQVVVPVEPGEYSAFPYKTVPTARPITILHLLTHTAGLANQLRGMTTSEYLEIQKPQSPDETVGDFVKRLAQMPLNFQPGEAWEYSRATCVIGHLVEIISGMTLDEFFRKRIFEPLGMHDTHFFLPTEKLDRFAAAYTPGNDRKIQLVDAPTEKSRWVREPHAFFSGSGGLVSTAPDYFRFNQMMLNGGELDGVRILGRKTVELMTRNHIGNLPVWLTGPWAGFGLGYAVVKPIEEVEQLTSNQQGPIPWSEGSYTWGGMYCTYSWNDPVEQLTGIMMTQVWPYQHLMIRQDFVGLANQAIVD